MGELRFTSNKLTAYFLRTQGYTAYFQELLRTSCVLPRITAYDYCLRYRTVRKPYGTVPFVIYLAASSYCIVFGEVFGYSGCTVPWIMLRNGTLWYWYGVPYLIVVRIVTYKD